MRVPRQFLDLLTRDRLLGWWSSDRKGGRFKYLLIFFISILGVSWSNLTLKCFIPTWGNDQMWQRAHIFQMWLLQPPPKIGIVINLYKDPLRILLGWHHQYLAFTNGWNLVTSPALTWLLRGMKKSFWSTARGSVITWDMCFCLRNWQHPMGWNSPNKQTIYTPGSTNIAGWEIHHEWVDVFPFKKWWVFQPAMLVY